MTLFRPSVLLAVSLLLSAPPPVLAQAPGAAAPAARAAPEVLTPETVRTVVADVRRVVGEEYFDETKRPAVVAALAEGLRSGRYAVSEPAVLAQRLSEDMRRVTSDKHMYVRWSPDQATALRARAANPKAPDMAFFNERTRRGHHGLQEMRILPGNVRYLKISSFVLWDEATSPAAYDAAMRFLKEGDAAVVDLRGNGGGYAEPVEYLLSHFLPPGVLMHTSVMAKEKLPAFTAANLPAGRMVGKPLYVLIDKGSASATEAAALSVDRFKLGELIGETTSGGGHRNTYVAVAPGFVVSVSTGTVRHGLDGTGWEGTGVAPHVKAAPERALEVAHARALERLASTGPEPLRAEYRWSLEAARAALDPPKLTTADLAAYAGRYEDVTVTARDGRLYRQREGAADLPLTPVAKDTFAVGTTGDTRLRFERDAGAVVAATFVTKAGPMQRLARAPRGAPSTSQRSDAGR